MERPNSVSQLQVDLWESYYLIACHGRALSEFEVQGAMSLTEVPNLAMLTCPRSPSTWRCDIPISYFWVFVPGGSIPKSQT